MNLNYLRYFMCELLCQEEFNKKSEVNQKWHLLNE